MKVYESFIALLDCYKNRLTLMTLQTKANSPSLSIYVTKKGSGRYVEVKSKGRKEVQFLSKILQS